MYHPSGRLVRIVNRIVNPTAMYSVPMTVPQNFSGRSIAYTKYTNAAMLNNKDKRVMASPRRGHTA